MLHSAYDLQEALSWTEFVWIIEVSVSLLEADLEDLAEDTLDIENPSGLKLMGVRGFREFNQVTTLWPYVVDKDTGEEKKSLKKIPAAILTQWHTVGEAADVVWH